MSIFNIKEDKYLNLFVATWGINILLIINFLILFAVVLMFEM